MLTDFDLRTNIKLSCSSCRNMTDFKLVWSKNNFVGFQNSNMPTTVRECSNCGSLICIGYQNKEEDFVLYQKEMLEKEVSKADKEISDAFSYMKSRILDISNEMGIADTVKEMLESKVIDLESLKKK